MSSVIRWDTAGLLIAFPRVTRQTLARLTVSDRTSLDVSRGWPIPPGRPTTSTSRPVRGRSRCWRPRGVSREHRSSASGRAGAGWPADPRRRAAGLAACQRRRSSTPGRYGRAVMPGRLDQQPSDMGVAGLGDRTLGPRLARGVLGGHQPEVGADRPTGQPRPVTDLDGQPERGQRRDAPQTTQPAHHRGELAVERPSRRSRYRGGGGDPRWPAWRPARCRRPVCSRRGIETLPTAATARGHRSRSCPPLVDDAVTQQQFRDPVPGPHQIRTAILTGPHQIAGGFTLHTGNRRPA